MVSRRAGPGFGGEQVSTCAYAVGFCLGGSMFDRKERLELTRRHLELALDRLMARLGRAKLNSHVAGLGIAVHDAENGI